jgi:hypothetical protein
MKIKYYIPESEVVPLDLRETLLNDSLRSNGDINDTNPEIDWGSF